MSMITLTFENFLCRDCGFLSPGAELKSFSTVAHPLVNFSMTGPVWRADHQILKDVASLTTAAQ